ncbi:hypothetical protein DMB38_31175 [Streptomyces sp. WAC 06738]|uniref:hypothetical protein n=1 Tax=Streptomyces sp. WAC 06738 TaxID=2203210 RepID=UPI000F6BA01F|nr:hypothetical protein [Streptomyces sp. WAC 06738]AZM49646.1 hypothetical protein DMB38_31175 [Streptomyces sp. WAC 06738]
MAWAVQQVRGSGVVEAAVSMDVGRDSVVMASVTEVDASGTPFIGAAPVIVQSVVPNDGFVVRVRAWAGWPQPIDVRITALNLSSDPGAFERHDGVDVYKGAFVHRFDIPGATPQSSFIASIAEYHGAPHMGAAMLQVHSVAPRFGEVLVAGNVDWHEQLPIRLTLVGKRP